MPKPKLSSFLRLVAICTCVGGHRDDPACPAHGMRAEPRGAGWEVTDHLGWPVTRTVFLSKRAAVAWIRHYG